MQITSRKFGDFIYFLFALLLVCTSLNIGLNFGGGTTDLSENSLAEAPTNTGYWIDDTTQTALGVDFDNYTLTQDTSASTTTYLIQSETDLAFLSWTIYNDQVYGGEENKYTSGSFNYYYSDVCFKQTKNLDLSAYYWQPIGIDYTRDGTSAIRSFSGNYDGGGHAVSGVFTPAGSSNGYSYQGLFGYIYGRSTTRQASISNLGVIDSFIQGVSYVGGVVGYEYAYSTVSNVYNTGIVSGSSYVGGVVGIAYATVSNVYNTGSVIGTGGFVGGVVGDASNSTISNAYNTGSVSGSSSVGGVVGNAHGTVSNVCNTGSVSGSGENVGGVVGSTSRPISNAYNTGLVSGDSQVGGVVGYTYGTVSNVYNTGSVSGSSFYVGGVVGRAYNGADIRNAYNTGIVSGTRNFVGGVVGYAYSATITNVYNTGSVSGRSDVGGVVGDAGSNTTVTNTYYGGDCTLPVGIGDGEGSATKIDRLVEEWAKNEEWYSAEATLDDGTLVWDSAYPWDFENVWNISVVFNGGYPCFDAFWIDASVQKKLGVDFTNYTLSSSETETDTYLIQSETDLAFLSWTIYTGNAYNNHVSGNYYYSGIYFKQTKNLDLSAYYWQPIGIYYTRTGTSASRYFSGNYDGGGYTVSGVFTPAGSGNGYSNQGLFGRVYGRSSTQQASIANVGVIDSFVQGYSNVGGVVGHTYRATITNAYNTGIVSGSSFNVGGVVGYAVSYATISNVYNTGSIKGTGNYVGGVVGYVDYYATISNVYNTGSVSGNTYVGGVVGSAHDATVSNVYNTGSVSGNTYVGGVVGSALGSVTISDCGVECAVITGTSNVGIFVGQNASSSAKIENCYAIVDGDLSPYGSNSGTFTNCLWIVGGVKYRYGTDFSAFAWPNADSCPVPKSLSWIGQFWTGDITAEIMASSEWTEWVA